MREELAAGYVGLSVSTIRAERAAGRFPSPILLTPGRHVYLRDDLDTWLNAKAGRPTLAAESDGSEWLRA